MEQGISVIVPTKGRIDYVRDALLSLVIATKHSPEPVQIIIVDDSSEKDAEVIKTLCENHGVDYFYHRGGVSDARNFGISQAKFPIVFFIDSDCKVSTHIFGEHLKSYSNENIGGCLGITEFVGAKTKASDITEMMPFMHPFKFAKSMEYAPWGPCTNISFRKDILNEVKGFNSFIPPKEGGEDVDLGYRICQLGYKIKCNPNAAVSHSREALRGWSGLIERAFRWGRAEVHLLSQHSENSFFDVPKSTLLFGVLLMVSLFKSFTTHTPIPLLLPFLWISIVTLIQGFCIFYQETSKSSWRELIYSFVSTIVNFVFELGMIVECLYRRKFKLLLFTFIYEERQLYDRWYQGKMKTWSFVISFLILYAIYNFLL